MTWTSKLYFNKYTHAISIVAHHQSDDIDPVTWCSKNIPGSYRKREESRNKKCVITRFYCNNTEYQLLLNTFKQQIINSIKPFSDEAEQYIRQGIEIQIRPHLYYNKYRYSIHLYIKNYESFDIAQWCSDNLGTFKSNYYHGKYNVNPILYVLGDSELLQVKLALSEYVHSINRAYIETEVDIAIR